MYESRTALASFVGASADDLVYVPNTTTGVNMVARSLALEPGDEVLSTGLEYGAAERTWQWICRLRGANFVRRTVSLPLDSPEQMGEAVWGGKTDRTRVLFLSHITSTTALIMPLAELVSRARDAGIITVIDGAHGPGQVPVDLNALGADFYTANCHKWMMAPKGSAFLYASPDRQDLLDPLIVSWGNLSKSESRFVQENEWQGTRDIAAYLSVPAAIKFREDYDWARVQKSCFDLLAGAREKLLEVTGIPPICPASETWFRQMASHPLPSCDGDALKAALYDRFRVEVPIVDQNGVTFIRVSIQGYNTASDVDTLVSALSELLTDLSS
jgi:isopenicillin-N epimerase